MGNLLTPAGCGTPLGWLLIGAVAETAWAHKASGGQVLTDPGHREADIADALDKLAADPVFPVGGVVVDVPAASREATPDALLLVARLVRMLDSSLRLPQDERLVLTELPAVRPRRDLREVCG